MHIIRMILLSIYNIFFIIMSYNINKLLIVILLLITLPIYILTITAPTWITSQQFQAGTLRVIDGVACNCQVTQNKLVATFVTSFSTTPMIVVGASSIDANAFVGNIDFQVSIDTISSTSVKVNVDMREDLWTVQARYIAIDDLFPYHVNCFQHVHADVNSGYQNITTPRTYQTTYTNMVNYTQLANSKGYNNKNTFTGPISNYRAALYLGCFISQSATSTDLISFTLEAIPINSQTIKFYITAGIQFSISKLHMGLVVMDVVGVSNSDRYILVYGKLELNETGGYYVFPIQSQTTFMYGLTDFGSPNRNSYMSFFTEFSTVSGNHQVIMKPSTPRASKLPINKFGLNYFYLKQYICPPAYFFNKTIELCVQCTIGCLNCTSLTSCTLCDNTNSYFLNSSSGSCKLCSDSIPGCLTCSSLTSCIDCDQANQYLLSGGTCQPCLASQNKFINMSSLTCVTCSISNCVNCSSLTTCYECSLGFYLDTDGLCYLCNIVGCLNCSSLTQCVTCDSASNYIKEVNNTCTLCPTNTFANPTTNICGPCSIANCLTCQTASICSVCDTAQSYYLSSGSCSYCDPNLNQFIIYSNASCSVCYPVNCIVCSSLTECSLCLDGYYRNSNDSLCYPCPTGCVTCTSLTFCNLCIPGYVMNMTTHVCDLCTPISCPTQQICGDFINSASQQCDDGNLDSGDGCSNSCQIQPDFICQPSVSNPFGSACFFVGVVRIEVVYIDKIQNQNKVHILLEFFPKGQSFWNDVDFTKVVEIQSLIPITGTEVVRHDNGTVSLVFQYEKSIQGGVINVQINMTNSGISALQRTPITSNQLIVNPTQNQAAYFYDSSIYDISQIISLMCSIIAGCSLFFFILGLISGKMIGVDLMSVVQVSFFSLMTMVGLNPTFAALRSLQLANGYNNLGGNHLQNQLTPYQARGLYLFSRFIQNFNFTTVIIIVPLLVALISFILSKTIMKNNQRIKKIFIKSLGEYTLNGLLFSGYIISVCATLNLKYGSKKSIDLYGILSFTECAILSLLMIFYIMFLSFRPKYFGQFTEELKQNRLSTKYYALALVERLIVGICLVLLLQINYQVIVPILLFISALVYILVKRPFTKKYNNIRVIFNMLIASIINSIYLVYRLTPSQKTSQNKTFIYLPLLIVLLLIICVIYNVVLIIYTIYTAFTRKTKEDEIQFQSTFNQSVLESPQKFVALPESDRIHNDLIRQEKAKQVVANYMKTKRLNKKTQEPLKFINNQLAQGNYDQI